MRLETGSENTKLKERLEKIVSSDRISHAYLFEGPFDIDKEALARGFIKGVLCPKGLGENCGACNICSKVDHGNHEDVSWFGKEGLSVKNDVVETIQDKLNVRPVGERNVIVISDCDTMTQQAQNRLLKTLEEPPGNALIILLSENMENLAPTILSRCVKFRIDAQSGKTLDASAEELVRMALAGRRFHELVHAAGESTRDRAKAGQLLDSMERVFRDMLLEGHKDIRTYKSEEIGRYIEQIEEARTRLNQKMSAEYAMKELLLEITE